MYGHGEKIKFMAHMGWESSEKGGAKGPRGGGV